MKLLFGIGNPGKEYEGTRHNVGWDFVTSQGEVSGFVIGTPENFVNLTGQTVKRLKAKYKLKNDDIYIVQDDLDIEFGKCKISFDRNSAGHKGVQSVIDAIKTKKFWRVRIGIANSKLKNARAAGKVPEFVLSKFTPTEQKQLPEIFQQAYDRLNHA